MGQVYTVEALVQEVLRDSAFYRNSGGGVTLSGGEATLYPDFQMRFLQQLTTSGNLQGIADFLRLENIHEVALLPYNPLWSEKAEHLGRVLRGVSA